MQLSSLLLTAAVSLVEFQGTPQSGGVPVEVEAPVVTLIDEVKLPADLPSQEAGVLTTLRLQVVNPDGTRSWGQPVRAGMSVVEGQVLGQIDNTMAGKMQEVAKYKVEMAEKEADNQVSVKYAKAACDVARADWESAMEANRIPEGTVTKTELRRLVLLHEQYKLQIEQALYELGIAAVSVNAQKAQLEAANHDVGRREIVSPIDGIIVEVYPHEKEWIRPGEPIVHIVRMDQLWVEGRLPYTASTGVVAGSTVKVTCTLPDDERPQVLTGEIDFVSPLVDQSKRLRVRAVVNNQPAREPGKWLLRPGMPVEMTIDRAPANASKIRPR